MPARQPYQGAFRKLVLAFDVGTTYSAVSYSILNPGKLPVICRVNRFPGIEQIEGNSKIPTVVYYDNDGNPRAFGGEALQHNIIEQAEDEQWIKLEWWTLHIQLKNLSQCNIKKDDIPPLPPFKTAVQVYADFMQYLFQCAKRYIEETHGQELWSSCEDDIDFVLSCPNDWKGSQQMQIRQAAVLAGLVPDSPAGQARVQVVTEGEATAHFCLANVPVAGGFKDDQGVMVINAGSGMVDVSCYCMTTCPAALQELAPPECQLAGSAFVTRRAKHFLKERLKSSKFGNDEDVAQMTSEFDKTTKFRFSNPSEPSYIHFGNVRDRDLAVDIRSGQLKLCGSDVASFFEPSVVAIIAAVENQRATAKKPISTVFLAGSFAASDWLFSRLQAHVAPLNINSYRPDSRMDWMVVDGAIVYYLDHSATPRVTAFTYGTRYAIEFNKNDEQHRLRAANAIRRPSGRTVIPNAFNAILTKGTTVWETKEFKKDFVIECAEQCSRQTIATEIVCYRGDMPNPLWTDSEPGMFTNLCTVYADPSHVSKILSPQCGLGGRPLYRQQFSVILLFGLTDLQAQISWMENGEEKRGPATVVFDQVIEAI